MRGLRWRLIPFLLTGSALLSCNLFPASSQHVLARDTTAWAPVQNDFSARLFAAQAHRIRSLYHLDAGSLVKRYLSGYRVRSQQVTSASGPGRVIVNNWALTPTGHQSNLGDFPVNSVLSSDGIHMLVVNSGAGMQSLQVVNTVDGSVAQTIPYYAPHSVFIGVAYSPDGTRAYASGGGENVIHTYAVGADGTLNPTGDVAEAKVSTSVSTSSYPSGLSVSRDGKTLYVANSNANNVAFVDVTTQTVRATVSVGTSPYTTLVNPSNGLIYVSNWGDASVSVIDPTSQTVVATISVGNHPTAMINGPYGLILVSDSNSDAVSAIDTQTNREVTRASVSGGVNVPPGASPQGLATSPDGKYLFVANAGDNAIAEFTIGIGGTGLYFQGWIPTAWYPTSVQVTHDGSRVLVTNGFGIGEGPNNSGLYPNPLRTAPMLPNIIQPAYCNCTFDQFSGSMDVGTLSSVTIPTSGELTNDTLQVAQNDRFFDASVQDRTSGNPVPLAGGSSPIRHVIYIIKENRTFDQILGDEPAANSDPSLTIFGKSVTPNMHALAERFGLADNFYADAQVSADGHNWVLSANASDYVEKTWPQDYSPPPGRNFGYPFEGMTPLPLSPGGYIWDAAAHANLSYRDYGLYALFAGSGKVISADQSCAGPIARNYLGTTIPPGDVLCFPPTQVNPSSAPNLVGHVDPNYQNYDMRYLDTERVAEWKREFNQYETSRTLPNLELIRLSSDHTSGTNPGSYTPQSYLADNDAAVGQIVDTVSHSADWGSTAIFVTEDDAQNGPDHVDSHRTLGLVISPFTSQAAIRADHTHYDSAAMVRTIELLLGMKPLSRYDATATPMWRMFSGTPDMAPFTAIAPSTPMSKNPQNAFAARESASMNFALPDQAPAGTLNRILWHAVKGVKIAYPAAYHNLKSGSVPTQYIWGALERSRLQRSIRSK